MNLEHDKRAVVT